MAGPAIRAWQIASALSAEHEVQLVTTTLADLPDSPFPVRAVDDAGLAEVEQWCDVLVFQGWLVHKRPFLLESDKILVADVYDPLHLEQLEQGRDDGWRGRILAVQSATAVLNEQLLRGDYFLCASEKQRDFWLGQLSALGRVNPVTYDADETLRSLISVVPVRCARGPAGPHPAGDQGRRPRHRPGRQGPAVGRGHLQLVRPPHPAACRRPPAPAPARRAPVLPRAQAPEPRHPRDAHGGRRQGAVRPPRAHRHPRLLQRGLGGVRRPPQLPPRRRHRRQHPPRPRGDGVLVPDPGPRLPVGLAAHGRHRRRRPGRPDRVPRARPHRAGGRRRRPRVGAGLHPRRRRPAGDDGRRRRRRRHKADLAQGAGAARRVLPGPEAGPGPAGAGGHRRLPE